jgi:hypothetical protein
MGTRILRADMAIVAINGSEEVVEGEKDPCAICHHDARVHPAKTGSNLGRPSHVKWVLGGSAHLVAGDAGSDAMAHCLVWKYDVAKKIIEPIGFHFV